MHHLWPTLNPYNTVSLPRKYFKRKVYLGNASNNLEQIILLNNIIISDLTDRSKWSKHDNGKRGLVSSHLHSGTDLENTANISFSLLHMYWSRKPIQANSHQYFTIPQSFHSWEFTCTTYFIPALIWQPRWIWILVLILEAHTSS